ncbi:unnamed protein product, partial [marine sediment metagenome]
WITAKEFKQQKSQSNPPNKKRNKPASNVDVGQNAKKQFGGADTSNETSSAPSTPIDSGVVASYMLGLGQDIDSSGPAYMSRTDANNELLSNAFASYDERTAIGDEIIEIGAANADPNTVNQVNAALRGVSQQFAMQYPNINLAQPLYEQELQQQHQEGGMDSPPGPGLGLGPAPGPGPGPGPGGVGLSLSMFDAASSNGTGAGPPAAGAPPGAGALVQQQQQPHSAPGQFPQYGQMPEQQ